MTPIFSILHATYGRPAKAVEAMRRWVERAEDAHALEYLFACNVDDPAFAELSMLSIRKEDPCRFCFGEFKGSAPAWDAAAKASNGLILIQAQDDVEPPPGWDTAILRRVAAARQSPWTNWFMGVGDGYRIDKLCCTAIMSRARYEARGEFIHPGYISVFSDDDVTVRAYADHKAGLTNFIEARDLVFTHRHHYHDKTVPLDETYLRENSEAAYKHGHELFHRRNADALKFRTW